MTNDEINQVIIIMTMLIISAIFVYQDYFKKKK